MGIKPLYYYNADDCFVFGSEIKALLTHPEIKPEVNDDGLYDYLTVDVDVNVSAQSYYRVYGYLFSSDG